jgi:hypothetical protein
LGYCARRRYSACPVDSCRSFYFEAALRARLVLPLAPSNKSLAQTNKSPKRGQTHLSGIGLKVIWEKQRKQHTSLTTAE